MIKRINRQNFITTPFTAIKEWNLYNVENDTVILLDSDDLLALDYVDYSANPLLNRDCDIAMEQQEADEAQYEEGISGSGYFDPAADDKNASGTSKRLLHDQIARAFYNTYRNPLQIFGMNNIDLPLDQTNKALGNQFILFSIPRNMMGDRLVAGSIQMYDNLLDDNVRIVDDKVGNLLAGDNLFSKVQEVRSFGNEIIDGSTTYVCPTYGIQWQTWNTLWENLLNNWETYG